MKTILSYLVLNYVFIGWCIAQVGINTNTPAGVLHIEAGITGDTSDDIVINNLGQVGIGTSAPTHKLHIKTASATKSISIKDGNEGDLKMLVSDAQGVGTWDFIGLPALKGVLSTNGRTYLVSTVVPQTSIPEGERYYPLYPLDGTITLPPGRWCVYSNFLLSTSGAGTTDTYATSTWIRLTYSDTYGGPSSQDIIGAPWSSGAVYAKPYGMIQGFSVILNSTSGNKTYYLGIVYANQNVVSSGVQINSLATNTKEENGIIAIKIADN
ncbi:hypothetical protein [Dysgonomonas macrotermitis]|uniref:Uncharacterized protein n=1 Tax=Dysgonomonas macrotermitis TaxID=1346286 RepID=A0A1M5K2J4_9BACT|nr:hypothetical protein [Dysgonomonas macrotermitis]SHG46964.1 hypothetical protein SAMN05444362_1342 [Dysgonomonas macrotermitis]